MEERRARIPLEPLDPGSADPGYWARFEREALARATEELARRLAAHGVMAPGVGELLVSWWRSLVPAALVAAVLAGFLLTRAHDAQVVEAPRPLALEELLVPENAEALVELLTAPGTADAAAVLLAAERY